MTRKPKLLAPPMPPPTAEEIEMERKIVRDLRAMNAMLLQRNLDTAVLLAQQAARGQGPLVDHFQELGRRFAEALNSPPKSPLRLVKGDGA